MSNYHTPVLVDEVIEGLKVAAGKRYIDATVGGGGHTFELLKRGCFVLGIDEDSDALDYVKENFKFQISNFKFGDRLTIVQGNFRNIEEIAKNNGFDTVDGVLFDLGVSSHQLNEVSEKSRGFSFRYDDAPLDMRFGDRTRRTAGDIIQSASAEELYTIFAEYGEEEHARTIAEAVVHARKKQPIVRTGQLKGIIQDEGRARSRDTLARIFQALRIAVNDEMSALQEGLVGAEQLLKPGGRIAVISFHSLEDRIVKRFCEQKGLKKITKKPIRAGSCEQQTNARSRSAKLRIAEKQ